MELQNLDYEWSASEGWKYSDSRPGGLGFVGTVDYITDAINGRAWKAEMDSRHGPGLVALGWPQDRDFYSPEAAGWWILSAAQELDGLSVYTRMMDLSRKRV